MTTKPKTDTEALDAYFASFEPIDVRTSAQMPSKLPPASSRVSSRTRSTRRLCLETLEAREVPATLAGIESAIVRVIPDDANSTYDEQEQVLIGQITAGTPNWTAAQEAADSAPVDALQWTTGANIQAAIRGTLNAHPGQNMYGSRFSPDGERFVTVAQDRTAKIWNAATGALERTLTGANSLVIDAVWSADGQSLWTTSYDRHVRQYSVSNGSLLWDSGDLGSLALSASMTQNGSALIVDLHGSNPIAINTQSKATQSFAGSLEWADGVANLDAGLALAGGGNGPAILNPANGQVVSQLTGLGNGPASVAATPDGQWIFGGGDSGALAVWKRSTGQKIFTLPGQAGYVTSMAVSQDGALLLVGSGSQVTAFDLRPLAQNQTPTLLKTWTGLRSGPRGMSISGATAIFTAGDGNQSIVTALDLSGLAPVAARLSHANQLDDAMDDMLTALAGIRADWAEEQASQQTPEEIARAALLADIEELCAPWSVSPNGDPHAQLTQRGELLHDASIALVTFAETQDVIDQELQTAALDLSAAMAAWQQEQSRIAEADARLEGTEGAFAERTWSSISASATATAVSPNGGTMATVHQGTVRFHDAGNGETLDVAIALPSGFGARDVSYLDDGGVMVTGATGIAVVDPFTRSVRFTKDFGQQVHAANARGDGFDVVLAAQTGAGWKYVRCDASGTITTEHGLDGNTVNARFSGDLMIHGVRSVTEVFRLGGSQTFTFTGIDMNFAEITGYNPWLQAADAERGANGRTYLVGQSNAGPSGFLVALDAQGNRLGSDVYNAGPNVRSIRALGAGYVLVDSGGNLSLLKFSSNQFTQIWSIPAAGNTDVQLSPDASAVIITDASGIRTVNVGDDMRRAVALTEAAASLGTLALNVAAMPDTPAGKAATESLRFTLLGSARDVSPAIAAAVPASILDQFLIYYPQYRTDTVAYQHMTAAQQRDLVEDRAALVQPYIQALGAFEDALARRMEAAMNATLTELHGGNPAAHLQVLNNRHLDPIYGNTIQRLAGIGIHQPDSNVLLEAAQRMLEQRLDSLRGLATKSQAVTERMLDDFNSPGYAGSGSASLSANQRAEAAITHRHNMAVIAASEGTGDTAGRLAGYAEEHKDSGAPLTLFQMYAEGELPAGTLAAYKALTGQDARKVAVSRTQENLEYVALGMTDTFLHPAATTPVPEGTLTPSSILWTNTVNAQGGTTSHTFTVSEPLLLQGSFVSGTGIQAGKMELVDAAGRIVLSMLASGNNPAVIKQTLQVGSYTLRFIMPTVSAANIPAGARFGLEADLSSTRSSAIEGTVQLGGSEMPVSLRVAEFEGSERKTDYHLSSSEGGVNTLDFTKPVWVVIHGMNGKEDSAMITEMARSLTLQGVQVVTLDWRLAAKDFTNTGLDAVWTDVVGQWAARQLMAAGFAPHLINGAGHSHGTYALHAMGKELMRLTNGAQMNTLLALDPAGDVPWNGYDHTKVDFGAVSARAISFESAFIADSDRLAGTADMAFRINSPSTVSPISEHSLGFSTFMAIMNHERTAPGAFSEFLSFQKVTTFTQADKDRYDHDEYGGKFEAEIDVNAYTVGQGEDAYLQGIPTQLRYKKPGETTQQIVSFNTFG